MKEDKFIDIIEFTGKTLKIDESKIYVTGNTVIDGSTARSVVKSKNSGGFVSEMNSATIKNSKNEIQSINKTENLKNHKLFFLRTHQLFLPWC